MIVNTRPQQADKIEKTLASWGFAIDDDVIFMTKIEKEDKRSGPEPVAVRGDEVVYLSRNDRTGACRIVEAKMTHKVRKAGEGDDDAE